MTTASEMESGLRPFLYVARQPVFTASQGIVGYELLFRKGRENLFQSDDPEHASRSVIDIASLHGFKVLSGGRLAFINCTRETLISGAIRVLHPEQVVVEIQESVTADEQVRSACIDLRAAGYRIALDDFIPDDPRASLVDLASFLKVDITVVAIQDAMSLAQRYRGQPLKLLAEKVEGEEDFDSMKASGFHLFQGRFFCRPQTLRMRMAPTDPMVYRKLIETLSRPQLNLHELESAIKLDPKIFSRQLRYLNAAVLGLRNEIRSLRSTPAQFGEEELARWRGLAMVLEMTAEDSSDQELSSLIRARYGEMMEMRIHRRDAHFFLSGLQWLMTVLLGIPMRLVLEDILLEENLKDGLLDEMVRLASAYHALRACEFASWNPPESLSNSIQLGKDLKTPSQLNVAGSVQINATIA
jgi:EAL and modified HD-GYP domain-containing signal transduction protein